MSVIVTVPGHGDVEFPDGMSDAEMEAAIRKNFMLPPKTQAGQKMEESPSYLSRLGKIGMAGLQGTVQGASPIRGMLMAGGESVNQANQVLEKAAYDAGGKVTDATGSPELGYAANVVTQAVPTVLGGLTGKVAGSPVLKDAGKKLMHSALKPSKADHLSGRGARAVQTMLDEGVNVSAGGVAKMRGVIDSLNDEIAGIIQNSGARIDKNAVASRLNEVMKKYEASLDPADIKAIEQVWTDFLAHPQLAGKPDMAIQLAQRMKQAGNAKLGDAAYGTGLKPAAERDAYKGLVRGLKEEIASAEPAVAQLNAREANLINAAKIAQNRVAMDANKNPLGLGALITQPWMLPVWMWDRSPLGKSLAARFLHSGADPITTGVGAAGGGLYGAQQGQLYK